MPKYVAALDQGTTSTRCILFDTAGRIVVSEQREHEQIYPQPGWVEHDPKEIWFRSDQVIRRALQAAGATAADVAALGVTNQRETTVVWDRRTGEPIHNAIVWQDTRSDAICDELSAHGGQDRFRAATGLPIAPYFSATKVRWLLDHVAGARERAEAGDLLFGTIDTWLIWQLTGGTAAGAIHVTDVTNASRTLLMDLDTLAWAPELADAIGIPPALLPEIRPSSAVYGEVRVGALAGVPIAAALGDQQAATFGQTCFAPGEAKNTYGTGNFLLKNTGTTAVRSEHGLITGSGEVEGLASTVDDNGGVYFVPAFSGLYAPHWRSEARGVIAGLTRFVQSGHIARAVLEATAFQSREVVDAMNEDSGVALESLKVDGGMVVNETLMQFQADLLGVPVIRPVVTETTALGAAYAAGLATGVWPGTDDLREHWAEDRRWLPQMGEERREELFRYWKKAVERTFDWVEPSPPR